jgi:hypothetical protein
VTEHPVQSLRFGFAGASPGFTEAQKDMVRAAARLWLDAGYPDIREEGLQNANGSAIFTANVVVSRYPFNHQTHPRRTLGEAIYPAWMATMQRRGIDPSFFGVLVDSYIDTAPYSSTQIATQFKRVVAHEFGHLIGFGHVASQCGPSTSIMTRNGSWTVPAALSAGEKKALERAVSRIFVN